MNKQTFIDNMKACGYEPRFGNITATKGGNTVRLVPLADYGVYISTPSLKAITGCDGHGNAAANQPPDRLTIQPRRHTCGFESRRGTKTYRQ